MPIHKPAVVTHTLVNVVVDIPGRFMLCTFTNDIDGVGQGQIVMPIEAGDMLAIIGVQGDGTKSRADDITDAVYAHALECGAISESIA